MSHKAQIFSNNKVMPDVLTLQISTQIFPGQSYKAPKWQIWKCETRLVFAQTVTYSGSGYQYVLSLNVLQDFLQYKLFPDYLP